MMRSKILVLTVSAALGLGALNASANDSQAYEEAVDCVASAKIEASACAQELLEGECVDCQIDANDRCRLCLVDSGFELTSSQIRDACNLATFDYADTCRIDDYGYPEPDVDWRFPRSMDDFEVLPPSDGDPRFEDLIDSTTIAPR